MNKYFTRLTHTQIIGYIDHLDVVYSESFCYLNEENDNYKTHEELFGKKLKRWRWDYDKCFSYDFYGDLTKYDYDLIREHLTNKYRIPFYENGYHDVEFFTKMINSEKEN